MTSNFLFTGSAKISLKARLTPGSSKCAIKVIPLSSYKIGCVDFWSTSPGGVPGGVLKSVPPEVTDFSLKVSSFTISSDYSASSHDSSSRISSVMFLV